MAENINHAKQIKFALDSFAMDFDGRYPHERFHHELGTSGSSSNALLRQVFASEDCRFEHIFWAKDSPVCSTRRPDDRLGDLTARDFSSVLKPGDNHWAYFHGLSNGSEASSPILVEPFQPGTQRFDPHHHHHRAIMVRIDSSARSHRVTPEGRLQDQYSRDFLSPDTGFASRDLRQPKPGTK